MSGTEWIALAIGISIMTVVGVYAWAITRH
jgi:hypothetical protein